jgi:aspartyl-tRNA(Asn)/glutamyl-tRNA(Gln) amidotransferase subunit C
MRTSRDACGLHFEFCILHYDGHVPTTLTIADVERIAALAQLELTDEEKHLFTRQLADILHYAEQVQAIDTSGVPATAHVNAAQRTERDDEPRPSLPTEDAMANAPDAAFAAGLFRVPRVIGG